MIKLKNLFTMTTICTVLIMLLSACNNSSDNPNSSDNQIPEGPQNTESDNLQIDSSGCSERISSGRITIPTVLSNSANECDYFVSGFVQFLSQVTIEPGTTIVMGQAANISFSDGQLTAVGTPEQRIVVRGEAPLQGYWGGIDLGNMRPSRIEHVDIMDGGDNSGLASFRGGLQVSRSTVSLIDVSISNSQSYGLNLDSTARLSAFSNNRFYGNILEGITIPTNLIPELDAASDYLGVNAPNERPFILVRIAISDPVSATWKALNAPYSIGLLTLGSDESLTLEPGTQMVLQETSSDSSLSIFNNGQLQLNGTAEAPITIDKLSSNSGPWSTLAVAGGRVILNYVLIRGGTSGITIERDDSQVTVSNAVFEDHVNWGIDCDTRFGNELTTGVLTINENVIYRNNGMGGLNPTCPL